MHSHISLDIFMNISLDIFMNICVGIFVNIVIHIFMNVYLYLILVDFGVVDQFSLFVTAIHISNLNFNQNAVGASVSLSLFLCHAKMFTKF